MFSANIWKYIFFITIVIYILFVMLSTGIVFEYVLNLLRGSFNLSRHSGTFTPEGLKDLWIADLIHFESI
jgi:hypothetical protein